MGIVNSCFDLEGESPADKSANGTTSDAPKQYSWDQKRESKDPSQYIIENVNGGEVGRVPGDVNGEQIVIRNCENAHIYIFDHANTVSIDDCKNCEIFIGPTKSSLFIRDCSNCNILAACGQFRTRDCQGLTVFLTCPTQPIIEATTKAKFGCFHLSYPELSDQFEKAGLSKFNNMWWNVHDFTPTEAGQNWKLIGEIYKAKDYLSLPEKPPLNGVKLSYETSFVPNTIGNRPRDHEETSLILVFADGLQEQRASKILAEMEHYSEVELVKTRFLQLQDSDAERIFNSKDCKISCQSGPLIALQLAGPNCVQSCRKVVDSVTIATLGQGKIFTSPDKEAANAHIRSLFCFVDMQMGL